MMVMKTVSQKGTPNLDSMKLSITIATRYSLNEEPITRETKK